MIKVLNKIQLIKNKKIKTFERKYYKIKEYKIKILFNEAKLFCDWYVPSKLLKKFIFHLTISLKKRLNFYCQN